MESSQGRNLLHVEVSLYSTLRIYAPFEKGAFFLELPSGSTVASAIEALGIPEQTPKVVLLNGRHAALSDCLSEGDRLVFFPPVEGG